MVFTLIAALGFAALYAQTAFAHSLSGATALLTGTLVFAAFLVALLLPVRLFQYSNADPAPRVMTQVVSRAAVGSLVTLAVNVAAWFLVAVGSTALLEELYAYSFIAVFLFHGFGGAVASHVIYLQKTQQYNSNQLSAMLLLITLVLFVSVLLFLALDWGIARDAYVHLRDLTLVTLILLGYGRGVYLLAHH